MTFYGMTSDYSLILQFMKIRKDLNNFIAKKQIQILHILEARRYKVQA